MGIFRGDTLFRLHLVVGGVLSVACVALPESAWSDALYSAIAFGCVATMVVGVRRHRPLAASGWWLTTAGVGLWALADLLWVVYTWVLDTDPFPSPADALYLASYVLLAAGFARFVHARRGEGDREGVIDSLIFTVGFLLMSWVLLMRPGLESADSSTLARALAAAYPLGDVLLLALLVRLLTTAGARAVAFRWLVAANALLLAADCTYQYTTMHSLDDRLSDLPFLLAYVSFAAAAVHPSMRRLTDADAAPEADTRFTRGRLAALTLASLLSPCTLLVQLALGVRLEAWAVALTSVVLFLLVVARMSGLLRHLEQQASRLADMARTDALTGLPNRRTSDAELERMQTRARGEGSPLCVAVLDLDRFKAFNDTFGHQAGDSLLVAAAGAWRGRLDAAHAGVGPGRGAMLGRWGGEEFVLLLLGHDLQEAVDLVDALRTSTPAGQTFSAGVAQWSGLESPVELFGRADAALYAAKEGGRDRVVPAATAPVAGDDATSTSVSRA
ncbi:GGDEF domain-containing protein [Paenibacillus sp. TRM 82003]|uniref:GGDEF domain-containing protein n=1 Tax=Kineococcus sp. TRM81007 TaxID=2925831 RepID=UPI001F5A034D|nr:GGDEF domain-containing protein [Kineococcus sp. TRM81007]MCI2239996.1 GGDEF domain-containing protein [Kineococcus sp. TRM81007]MCI3925699.1 GGDEF domain-containing protein [Paenibacillus sp. TRM 82003]